MNCIPLPCSLAQKMWTSSFSMHVWYKIWCHWQPLYVNWQICLATMVLHLTTMLLFCLTPMPLCLTTMVCAWQQYCCAWQPWFVHDNNIVVPDNHGLCLTTTMLCLTTMVCAWQLYECASQQWGVQKSWDQFSGFPTRRCESGENMCADEWSLVWVWSAWLSFSNSSSTID